ncbi:MAG: SRPBCC domain-containing protein [Candidatus Hydrogenedentales bacterium]|jgi:uncharacterized protein YndB with AHSA1/START domain
MAVRRSHPVEATADREIVLSRVFDAPRELVFDAWTDPQKVTQWWGPNGFTTTIHQMDVRPGGAWKLTMHGPDGTDYPNRSVYLEVVPPERIVYKHGGARKGGPGANFTMTATFEEQGSKTKLTMRMLFASSAARDLIVQEYGAIEGGKQTLARLAGFLASDNAEGGELVITRVFDAPRELVFKAWTDPDLAKNWWGPRNYPAKHLEMDARPGGAWRALLKSTENQKDLWHGGVFREVVEPDRVAFTFAWEEAGERGLETLVTVTFAEHDRKTHMKFHQAPFRSGGERDGHHGGWTSCFDRLDDLMASQREIA